MAVPNRQEHAYKPEVRVLIGRFMLLRSLETFSLEKPDSYPGSRGRDELINNHGEK